MVLSVPFSPVSFSPEILSSVIPYYVFQPVDSSDSMRNCGLLTSVPCSGTDDPLQLCAWVLLHLCSSERHGVEIGPHHHCTSTSHTIKKCSYSTNVIYWGADKFLAQPGRKQATATNDFEFHISHS